MINISAFIIAKNEASRIARAINSVKDLVEEVIVVDSGSTDDTVLIAKNLGAKVIFNEWQGYVKQKSFAEKLCKNNWVLNIDADEELTKVLQEEIKQKFNSSQYNYYKAYEMNVTSLHRYDKEARFLAPSNRVIRLYNRELCSFSNTKNSTTHDSVIFYNPNNAKKLTGRFKNHVYHRSAISIEQLVAKGNFYSSEQAKDLVSLGRHPSLIRIALEFPLFFLKVFIIRRYFLFGFDGFIDSIIFAFARFIRLAKAREFYKFQETDKNVN